MKLKARSISGHMRILMQSRPNLFSHRGGDTVVLERLKEGLERLAITSGRKLSVEVDIKGDADPAQYDLVHLFNLVTTDITGLQARRALAAGTPYVVTTLYEDLPTFQRQSHVIAGRLLDYVNSGQMVGSYRSPSRDELFSITPFPRIPADFIVNNATVLMPNGLGESRALIRDFPAARRIEVVSVGSEIGPLLGPEEFQRVYGEGDFILCVGRLESRKNQLMLLKALEDSPLTVVLAGGGFSYQPQYEAAIRAFRRKGKTIILDRIDDRMLSSAYAACRIHVLPSWFELPGLVSLEAAARNKNVVVTRTGTTEDYLGDNAFYCNPWDSDSIYSAVLAAYHSPVKRAVVENANSYSWADSVNQTLNVYLSVVEGRNERYIMKKSTHNFADLLEMGEVAAKSGDMAQAEMLFGEAESLDPNSARLLRAKGAVLLAQRRTVEAVPVFERALLAEPRDPKVLVGRGMCELLEGRKEESMGYFERALQIQPDYLVALHQLLEASFALGTTERAVDALSRYLELKPDDLEIRFCLAGCLYKQGQKELALSEVVSIMRVNPDHKGAQQLRELMAAAEDNRQNDGNATDVQRLKISLGELIDRVTAWKVSSANTGSFKQQGIIECANEIGKILSEGGDGPRADGRSESAANLSLNELATTVGRIEDLKRTGEFAEADRELQMLIAKAEGDLDRLVPFREIAECLRAEFLVLEGDLTSASNRYDEVLARNPQSARALCGRGALAAEAGQWEEAKGYFNQAVGSDPDCDVAHAGLGVCAMANDEVNKAFDCFQIATEKNPENHRALLGLLQTGYPLKRYSEMERMLSAYLELHPASLDILYSFAGLLFAQGKVAEAKIEIEKILIFEPRHTNALELKGIIAESGVEAKMC